MTINGISWLACHRQRNHPNTLEDDLGRLVDGPQISPARQIRQDSTELWYLITPRSVFTLLALPNALFQIISSSGAGARLSRCSASQLASQKFQVELVQKGTSRLLNEYAQIFPSSHRAVSAIILHIDTVLRNQPYACRYDPIGSADDRPKSSKKTRKI